MRTVDYSGTGLRLFDRGERATFLSRAGIAERASEVAGGLGAPGVVPGEPVALLYSTGAELFDAFFSALFAAAAVVVGERRIEPGPRIVATRSIFYPDSERVMGWDVSERGFQLVLSAGVRQVVEEQLRADVDAFLAHHGLARAHLDPEGPLALDQRLVEDLELDSIRLLTLAAEIENHFRVTLDGDDEAGLTTIGDLVDVLARKLAAG